MSSLDFHVEEQPNGKFDVRIKTKFTDNKHTEKLIDGIIKGLEKLGVSY